MGAIAAHRAPERVADGTCTRTWAWMTDKYRRRVNGKEGYIMIEITQDRGGKKEKQQEGLEKGGRLLDERGVGSSCPRVRGPFSLGRWAVRF